MSTFRYAKTGPRISKHCYRKAGDRQASVSSYPSLEHPPKYNFTTLGMIINNMNRENIDYKLADHVSPGIPPTSPDCDNNSNCL